MASIRMTTGRLSTAAIARSTLRERRTLLRTSRNASRKTCDSSVIDTVIDPTCRSKGARATLITKNAQQKKHGAKQKQIEREMGGEAPVFARMTEAAAGDAEATGFCAHGGDDEDPN